ncbi:electron transfer flavoprotein subunit beta/FixA family protein [bacterium]|nr:electron transfer flavoprotein subunit beta/FixA family protein [bacterium]
MKIIVCVKQVPDTTEIKWTENNTIQREGVESIMNPYDVWALESALDIKRENPKTFITVITMGPNQAECMLRKAIALGADEAVLLSDRKFAGADTYATSKTLSQAIKEKFPDFDLIICGQFAIDGDTAQTGPSIAAKLDIPQVTFVEEIKEIQKDKLILKRRTENGYEMVETGFPSLICVLQKNYEPSRIKAAGAIRANSSDIKVFNADDINLSADEAGLKGSPTYVSKAFRPEKRGECKYVDDIEALSAEIGGANG